MTDHELLDQFGRRHNYLRISLTERCNLRCFYCMPQEGIPLSPKSHIMTFEEILTISKTLVEMGVDTIRLTGGEPLVRKDFDHLLMDLSRLGVKLKMTTNGILLHRHFNALKNAGLKDLNISLDTLSQEKFKTITFRNDFNQVMKNIETACAQGFHVQINVVVMKNVNEEEIMDFVAWTKHLPITVKFIEFMPFKDNQWDWSKGVSYQTLLSSIKNKYPTLEKVPTDIHSTSIQWQVPGFKGKLGMINSVTKPFCEGCNRLRLTADGKLKNCLFSNHEVDLLKSLRSNHSIDTVKSSIIISLKNKKKIRAGMEKIEDFSNPLNNGKNRTMISIGG